MRYAVALLMMAAAVAWSQPAGRDDGKVPRRGDHQRMMEQLKLTDDQQQKIDNLRVAFEKKQIATRAELQSARVDMRQLFRADKPERSKLEAKIKEIEGLTGELRLARIDHWFDVYALLTPDQQKIWKEHRMMDSRGRGRGRMMMHFHPFRGRDGNGPPMGGESEND